LWQILLKKSFFADDGKFSGPLVRLLGCEVRDHINCRKNDRWRSHRVYRALQRLKSPMRYICEIFGAPGAARYSAQTGKLAKHSSRAWLTAAAKRLHHNVLATALANKVARITWTVLAQGRTYEARVN
jgi:hypothetical protein